MKFDQIEENVHAFGGLEARVVLLVGAVGVVEAIEDLRDAFQPTERYHVVPVRAARKAVLAVRLRISRGRARLALEKRE
jgi:hypothetical protein